jgi:hypothetical protein
MMALVHYENWGVFDTLADTAYKGYSVMALPSLTNLLYTVSDTGFPVLGTEGSGKSGLGKSLSTNLSVVTVRPTTDPDNSNAITVNRGTGIFIPHPVQNTNQTRVFGMWFKVNNFSNSSAILSLGNASRTSIVVRLHTDGHLYFYSANGQLRNDLYVNSGYTYDLNRRVVNYFDSNRTLSNFGNTSNLPYAPVVANRWHYLEVKLRLATTGNGLLHVNIDGAPVLRVDGVNTNGNGTIGTNDRMLLSNYRWTTNFGAGSNAPSYGTSGTPIFGGTIVNLAWDSLTVMDTSGSVLNDFIGPSTLYSLKPTATTANGEFAENTFAPVGAATAHEAVQLIQNETTFVNGPAPANVTFSYADLPNTIDREKIHAVVVATFAKRAGVSPQNLQHTISNVNTGIAKSLNPFFELHQDIMSINPVTGLPWTIAQVNALAVKTRVSVTP